MTYVNWFRCYKGLRYLVQPRTLTVKFEDLVGSKVVVILKHKTKP